MTRLDVSRVVDILLLIMISSCLYIVYSEHQLHVSDHKHHLECKK